MFGMKISQFTDIAVAASDHPVAAPWEADDSKDDDGRYLELKADDVEEDRFLPRSHQSKFLPEAGLQRGGQTRNTKETLLYYRDHIPFPFHYLPTNYPTITLELAACVDSLQPPGFGNDILQYVSSVIRKASNAQSPRAIRILTRRSRVVTSQPFKFIVGEEKKEFLLHSALVASKSNVLDKMMNGRFAEARQGCAVLADVDANTMVTFAEFLYKGDYDLPHPIEPDGGRNAASPKPTSKSIKRDKVQSHVLKLEWKQPVDKYWKTFTENIAYGYIPGSPAGPILSENMGLDYSNFFISHAKVIIFADCYDVQNLMDLSMRKLHRALCGFRPSFERVSDVLALVRLCYDNPAPEKLKELLASYLACYTEFVFFVSSFKDLLRKKGDFAADLACAMASRILTAVAHERRDS